VLEADVEVGELLQVGGGERRHAHDARDALARRQLPGEVAQQVALRQRRGGGVAGDHAER
jgi:hypothetical protein